MHIDTFSFNSSLQHLPHRLARAHWLLAISGGLVALLSIAFVIQVPATAAAAPLFSWDSVAPSPIERFESQGLAVNGKLYVFGGFYNAEIQATTRSDVYDLTTNVWTQIADMPEALTHVAQTTDGTTIYLVGGYVGDSPGPATEHVWTYNISSNTWSAGLALSEPRGAGAVVLLGRSLHFFGGATRGRNTDSTVDHADHFVLALDGGTSWTAVAPLPNPRNHIAGAVLNGKIYAIGGQLSNHEGTDNQQEVDVYDPTTDVWQRAADLPTPRSHISASTFVMSNRIIVIGGSANNGSDGATSADVTMYDPATNVWVALPALPAGRKTPVAGAIGDRIIVTTGNKGMPTATTWVGVLPRTWENDAAAPMALGEVAGGIVGNQLYLVGEGSAATLIYNLSTNTWEDAAAQSQRPFTGNHHAAEVVGGKLYLFGGLGAGMGKVQIYDPGTNTWTMGADMPFNAGSSASALINGEVYVAGGIVDNKTTAQSAKYNPATNTWTPLAPMPQARNHAAAASDGTKLYIFGGRGPGSGDDNSVADGFDTVQIYNPASNTWASSLDAGSLLAPLPQARGGMGKAAYIDGEFYVIGGETLTGPGATANNVYDRVDIYNPHTNTWRVGTAMPTARHGIFPLALAGRIYVAGGGIRAGGSSSALLEVYNAAALVAPDITPTVGATTTATVSATTGRRSLYLPLVAGGSSANAERISTPTVTAEQPTPGGPTTTASATATATPTQGVPPSPTSTTTLEPVTQTATTQANITPTTTTATATATATATNAPADAGSFTTIAWSPIAPAPKANSEAQRAVVNGKLYVFGGFAPCCTPTRRAFVYDPETNMWTRLADMPKGITHAGMTTDGTNIYYAGGYIEGDSGTGQKFGTKQVWRYNIATNIYTPLPDLPIDRAAGVLVLIGRDLHYIGGTNKARTEDVGDHYVLSLDGGAAWTTATPLPNPRHHMGVATLDGQIYIIGGQHGHDGRLVPQTSVHRYNPTTNTWTELASLAIARNHITNATVVYGGRIIVFGGQVNHNHPVDNVDVYDPKTNTWSALTPLPMPRHSAVAAVINGVFYFSGGSTALSYKGIPGAPANNSIGSSGIRSAYRLDDLVSAFICR